MTIISKKEVCSRLNIHINTLDYHIKKNGFPLIKTRCKKFDYKDVMHDVPANLAKCKYLFVWEDVQEWVKK
jgi:hypothetical protein